MHAAPELQISAQTEQCARSRAAVHVKKITMEGKTLELWWTLRKDTVQGKGYNLV